VADQEGAALSLVDELELGAGAAVLAEVAAQRVVGAERGDREVQRPRSPCRRPIEGEQRSAEGARELGVGVHRHAHPGDGRVEVVDLGPHRGLVALHSPLEQHRAPQRGGGNPVHHLRPDDAREGAREAREDLPGLVALSLHSHPRGVDEDHAAVVEAGRPARGEGPLGVAVALHAELPGGRLQHHADARAALAGHPELPERSVGVEGQHLDVLPSDVADHVDPGHHRARRAGVGQRLDDLQVGAHQRRHPGRSVSRDRDGREDRAGVDLREARLHRREQRAGVVHRVSAGALRLRHEASRAIEDDGLGDRRPGVDAQRVATLRRVDEGPRGALSMRRRRLEGQLLPGERGGAGSGRGAQQPGAGAGAGLGLGLAAERGAQRRVVERVVGHEHVAAASIEVDPALLPEGGEVAPPRHRERRQEHMRPPQQHHRGPGGEPTGQGSEARQHDGVGEARHQGVDPYASSGEVHQVGLGEDPAACRERVHLLGAVHRLARGLGAHPDASQAALQGDPGARRAPVVHGHVGPRSVGTASLEGHQLGVLTSEVDQGACLGVTPRHRLGRRGHLVDPVGSQVGRATALPLPVTASLARGGSTSSSSAATVSARRPWCRAQRTIGAESAEVTTTFTVVEPTSSPTVALSP
jgi:hypothetical protein